MRNDVSCSLVITIELDNRDDTVPILLCAKESAQSIPCTLLFQSLKVSTHLASKARAMMPAASGAAAEVPVWLTVHVLLLSVVAIFWSE